MSKDFWKIVLIFATALMQGISIVTISSSGTIFISEQFHHLTSEEYGMIFLPMVAGGIIFALFGGRFAERWGLRPIFFLGLLLNIISLALFAFSSLLYQEKEIDIAVLLCCMFASGSAYGATLPVLNTYIGRFFSSKLSMAITAVFALLGTGATLAPLLVHISQKGIGWWIDPILQIAVFAFLIILGAFLLPNLDFSEKIHEKEKTHSLPTERFLIYLAAVIFYAYCETLFGTWGTIYLTQAKGITIGKAALAISAFWGMMTVGRLMMSVFFYSHSPGKIFKLSPWIMMVMFICSPLVVGGWSDILMFGLAGLIFSPCFPLIFSYAQNEFSWNAPTVAGYLVAGYMVGYGIAVYGIGVLAAISHLPLLLLFAGTAAVACLLALTIRYITN